MKLTKEQIQEITHNYTSKQDFKAKEPKIYNYIRNKGWLTELISHMQNAPRVNRSKQDCLNVAKNYTEYMDFLRMEPKYFTYAKRKGWLKDITSHMNRKNLWTEERYEEVKQEALKYPNRHQFLKGSPKHYYAADRYGWMNDITSHMTYQTKTKKYETV